MIARLRAWLMALVREAVRAEIASEWTVIKPTLRVDDKRISVWEKDAFNPKNQPVVPSKVQAEPSFEREQGDAIKEQEQFYAEQNGRAGNPR